MRPCIDGKLEDFTPIFETLIEKGINYGYTETYTKDCMKERGVYDMRKVVCWGVSAGGYFAVRVAHTHATRLALAIGHGAATHHFFRRAWLEKAKGHEYPWSGVPAVRMKMI